MRRLSLFFSGVVVTLCWVCCPFSAIAAPLDLTDAPLFLTILTKPNIMFLVDDSGSMDWEAMVDDAANDGRWAATQPDGSNPAGAGSMTHRDNNDDGVADCSTGKNPQTFNGYIYGQKFPGNTFAGGGGQNCNIVDNQAWRFRSGAFNPLYFNPTRTYRPWLGVDNAGIPFADMPITAAKDNPYVTDSPTVDLTTQNSALGTSDRDGDGQPDGFFYYTWNDLDGDGNFDNGEQTEHAIKNEPLATQQNFANWFSYYRKREYVTKAAYGEILTGIPNTARVALVTLNNSGGANTSIAPINTDPLTGQKRLLLDALYKTKSSGGTRLRGALDDVGTYLECDNGSGLGFADCPALPAAAGGACQQNFVIAMTDGFWNGVYNKIQNTDGPGSGNTPWDGGAYADNWDTTVADVAMHYYERDLHPGLDNNVPITPGIDDAKHQHMVTYGIAFGVNGALTSDPPNATDPFAWPDPALGNAPKIDDLRHAAYNGRGLYLSAKRPDELVARLKQVLTNIAERTSSAASVALNSGSHNANSRVYQARFTSARWTGQLLSFPLDGSGNVLPPEWDAGDVLTGQHWDTGRQIITSVGGLSAGVPFRWANLTVAQQGALDIDMSGFNDGEGADRLTYLRGEKTHELAGNFYRARNKTLGDLINSDPFFVGAPSFPYSLAANDAYDTFRTTYKNRTPMVYVGGNDGMLHGFAAQDGVEHLAYVPGQMFPALSHLTAVGYGHRYYVDGSPTVGDAQANFGSRCGASPAPCWRSVLVSGLRKGGQGVFALDVTDPAAFTESNAAKLVLWEFTDADDPDLGFTFPQPAIVKMANGQWAAVIGNGYNNTEPDANVSTTGHAVLYIAFLEKGLDGTWTAGSDFIKLDTGAGAVATPNGLATPAPVDLDGDTIVDYIYAGDLNGTLWRFDVRNPIPGTWAAPVPVFVATAGDGSPHVITTRPQVGPHPTGDPTTKGVLVYFGTGKYIALSDNTTAIPIQTFYAVWDKLAAAPALLTRAALLPQTVLFEGSGERISSANAIDWTTHHGWQLDLPTAGERQVSNSILRNQRIIFTTLIPNVAVCEFGGTSWLMEVDAHSGSRLQEAPFDRNGDELFDEQDLVTVTIAGVTTTVAVSGMQSTEGILPTPTVLAAGSTEFKFSSGSAGGIFATAENPGAKNSGRQAWRQLH